MLTWTAGACGEIGNKNERSATGGMIESLQVQDCSSAKEAAEYAGNVNVTPSKISTLDAGAVGRAESVRCFVQDLHGNPNYVISPTEGPVLAVWAARSLKRERTYSEGEFNRALQALLEGGADPCLGPTEGRFAHMTPLDIAITTGSRPSTIEVLRRFSAQC